MRRLKLAGLPALVWGFARLADLPSELLVVAVVTAGLPTGSNAFLLARNDSHLQQSSAAAVVVTTIRSVATIYLLLQLIV